MKTTRPNNRRKFLLAAGLGGAGALAAVAGTKSAPGPVQPVDAAASETKYRETDHIRKYYETTKV